jgi:predicted HAD superfamily Cof-like phosphohydrolase
MANTDNQCKDLTIKDYYKENGYEKNKSSLADLYNLQAKTQEMYFTKQGRKLFSEFTIGDLVDYLVVNNHAIIDELHEMMDAVGGINDGVGNAAWKPWKSANQSVREKSLKDLSEGDLKELKMEFIDVMHFVFNAGLAIGVTPQDFYNYYLSKNTTNWERQSNNY